MADPIPNKLNGIIKRQLIRELALDRFTQQQLADKYDVTQPAISAFAKRNADEIQAIRNNADDEFAGLLIVKKHFRLGTLQTLLEQAMTPQPKVSASGRVAYVTDADGNETMVEEVAIDSATRILKQVAEEMGQLPARKVELTADVNADITYRIEGADDV